MHVDCFRCDLKHVDKLLIDSNLKTELKFRIASYLENCDMSKTNPEIMNDVWDMITHTIYNDNPYKDIKIIL